MTIEAELRRQAIEAATYVTMSPHEWTWTQEQQVFMAHFCLEANSRLSLWQWLTDMRLMVQESAIVGTDWVVIDVDGEVLGEGETPEAAIIDAKNGVEGCSKATS